MESGRTGISVWEAVDIPQRRCLQWRFPSRSIWVERVEAEWHVLSLPEAARHHQAARAVVARSQKPSSERWRHFLHRAGNQMLPSPVMPDRPVVIRPDRELTLLPGQSTLFYVGIPVWFRLSTKGPPPGRIFDEPLGVLTRTWFGDPATGELCWGLATRLHHSLDSVDSAADVAVCPLEIENDSATDLEFQKICIHVENLSVFKGRHRLWTNSLRVVFRGPDQVTQIEIAREPPNVEPHLELASEARQPSAGWNIRKTFGMLRSFTEF